MPAARPPSRPRPFFRGLPASHPSLLAPSPPRPQASLPALQWDVSMLDLEEDRVIWVRAADLGKTAIASP